MQTLDKATLDSLVASCSGDIRGAINASQFTCRQGKFSTNIFRAFMVISGTYCWHNGFCNVLRLAIRHSSKIDTVSEYQILVYSSSNTQVYSKYFIPDL